jgi:hypothetical protein
MVLMAANIKRNGYKMLARDDGLQISDFGLGISDKGLWQTRDFGYRIEAEA